MAQTTTNHPAGGIRMKVVEGKVEYIRAGSQDWESITTNVVEDTPLYVGTRVRVLDSSKLSVMFSDNSVVTFDERSEFILQPVTGKARSHFNLVRGFLSFFHRDEPADLEVETEVALAVVRGTEFAMQATGDGRTIVTVFDGNVELSNKQGQSVDLKNHDEGEVEPGKAPVKRAALEAVNVIQWILYYPGVLDVRELDLTIDEQSALQESLSAYKAGDLLNALYKYPASRKPASDAEKIYLGALYLAVGQVKHTEEVFGTLPQGEATNERDKKNEALADAIPEVIAAVKLQKIGRRNPPELATEWLAESYYLQSQRNLEKALEAARIAATMSPEFGFAWARVAELEFSFGRIDHAKDALDYALRFSPRNAQAVALKGFILAAENKIKSATEAFEEAIRLDPGLGNAWLGRGLCKIRRGDSKAGREDLIVAAALEPQRGFLRSYLGKAYTDKGDFRRAEKELRLAKDLDPRDPTAWLYFALLKQQQNRINEAIREIEYSQNLNTNRAVYRSEFLLDQDRAVRSANLARIYADADMSDVAVREAGRAVAADYANYSAHVFLANSFEVQRRENLSNLRFEGVSFSEYLLANLLGPANGRLLAQSVTELEYGSLFERNRFGFTANTEYFSRGAWRFSGAQYGTYDGSSYSLEAEYRSDPGERVNQDLEMRQLEGKFKFDITPDDSVLLHIIDYESSGGDTDQTFDESEISKSFRFEQEQRPTVFAGYHHEWTPENHLLLLLGRLDDDVSSADPYSGVLALDRGLGQINGLYPVTVREDYQNRSEIYTVELQQIASAGRNTIITGARGQWSNQNISEEVKDAKGNFWYLLGPQTLVSAQTIKLSSYGTSVYAYDNFVVNDALEIIGGLNFGYQAIPVNTTTAPLSSERDYQHQFNPKGGIIWTPSSRQSFRGSYTRSLGGFGPGRIVSVEPSHIAGMFQSFRQLTPFSYVGVLDGADHQTAELGWEGHFRNTFLSLGGQWLSATSNRRTGLYLSDFFYDFPPELALIEEEVKFEEESFHLSIHQLLGKEWSFSFQYELARAHLKRRFPEYPGLGAGGVDDNSNWDGWLHTVSISGLYRHPLGIFAQAEALFFAQDRKREGTALDGDHSWQVNVFAGYRFPRQRVEAALGILNLLDNDYRLDPINHHSDLPRSRTFYARLLLNF